MVYEVSVTINKSIEEVIEVMRSMEHSMKWIKGLRSFELIEGQMDELNSKYKMVFKGKKNDMIMIETITELDLPNKITTTYEQGPVWNECVNLFKGHEDHTHYRMISQFKFPWYISLFIWMFKSSFIRETSQGMNDFKEYVESL